MKNKKREILLTIAYIIITIPMIFSMYNSVPASDDFAFGSRTISDNIFLDAIGYSAWNWLYHSGRWLTFFFQKLINPLNTYTHLGRVYGIWMICVFLIVMALLMYSLTIIYAKIMSNSRIKTSILVFFTIAILFTTYYYVEAYNWYIGATAYAIPFGLLMLTLAFSIRYEETSEKKYYVGLILSGLIPATNEFLDVPIGLLYLYIVFYVYRKNIKDKKVIVNRIIPLIVYVLCGISAVFAPGNFVRQDGYDVHPSATLAIKQIIIDIIVRIKDILLHHPLALVILMIFFVLGIKSELTNKWYEAIITIILTVATIFGTIFPYVYGRAMTTTYLDVRMQYLVDYVLLIGMCIFCLRLGMNANGCGINKVSKIIKIAVGSFACFVILVVAIHGDAYKKIVPIDIVRNRALIRESYYFWDDVIREIENSKEDEVVIVRKQEPEWTPYFLYMGIVEEDVYDESFDTVYSSRVILPNVYYKKNDLRIEYIN
ncbi:MAG: hypothetical protein IJJ59_12110 [Pseudobutyrivibrio sp.]|uniref:DUF6056 family protein n=1 Tax=Pseudobutyrivibrio sp. TaxID=2014367 RepID=UPI0025D8C8AE|nr:hypothetical protein [Pseudobutyrivibrio sp.]MBQ6464058.1 hypothetical protein [Pseudobutyrivibrio sp.]